MHWTREKWGKLQQSHPFVPYHFAWEFAATTVFSKNRRDLRVRSIHTERKIRSLVRPSRSSCYPSRARGKRDRNRLSRRFTSLGRDKIHEKKGRIAGDERTRKKQKDREHGEGKGRETSREPRDGNWISTSKVLGRLALLLRLCDTTSRADFCGASQTLGKFGCERSPKVNIQMKSLVSRYLIGTFRIDNFEYNNIRTDYHWVTLSIFGKNFLCIRINLDIRNIERFLGES